MIKSTPPRNITKIQRIIVDNRGKISQRKQEQLSSDLEIQSGYILVGVVLETFSEILIHPKFLSEETLSHLSYIFSVLSVYREPPSCNSTHILIIKTNQDTLKNISFQQHYFTLTPLTLI